VPGGIDIEVAEGLDLFGQLQGVIVIILRLLIGQDHGRGGRSLGDRFLDLGRRIRSRRVIL